jgi:hypothetical protein
LFQEDKKAHKRPKTKLELTWIGKGKRIVIKVIEHRENEIMVIRDRITKSYRRNGS